MAEATTVEQTKLRVFVKLPVARARVLSFAARATWREFTALACARLGLAHGCERVVIAGHSMGGAIALEVARRCVRHAMWVTISPSSALAHETSAAVQTALPLWERIAPLTVVRAARLATLGLPS